MKDEIQIAVHFLTHLIHPPPDKAIPFQRHLTFLLHRRYRDHWFPHNPIKGSGFRCIRINSTRLDPLLDEARIYAKLTRLNLPHELTVWIDPMDVSYRFGDNGSIHTLYSTPLMTMDLRLDPR